MKIPAKYLSMICAALVAACVVVVNAGCFSDSRPYVPGESSGPASTVASVAVQAPQIIAPTAAISSVVAPETAPIAAGVVNIADNYSADLSARIAKIEAEAKARYEAWQKYEAERLAAIQNNHPAPPTPTVAAPTKGQVEYEKTLAILTAAAAAFGFGKYNERHANQKGKAPNAPQ